MRTALIAFIAACRVSHPESDVAPPVAAKHPHAVTSPNGTREDPYYWLRDDTRKNPAVLAYLEAENAYAAKLLAPAKPLEGKLIAEMSARLDENESTARVFDNDYWYWTRYEAGKQRPIYMRQRASKAEILLDANTLATGHSFYAIGDYAVSRDNKLLAWTDDVVGRNQFELHVKNLDTGELFTDSEHAIAPSVEWAADNKTLFMVGKDPTTLREDRVLRHPLGGKTELVYQEADASFYVDIRMLKSRRHIAIELDATTTTETRLIDTLEPMNRRWSFARAKRMCSTKSTRSAAWSCERMMVRRTSRSSPGWRGHWWRSDADALIEDFAIYRDFVALQVRRNGLSHIEIVTGRHSTEIKPDEMPSTMSLIDTPDPSALDVRYSYESLVSPATVYEVGLDGKTNKKVLQRDYVPTYDATQVQDQYRHAGKVPISIVYRKDTKLDGTAPLLVFGYGAYGETLDPTFDRTPVSLLDRGWVYAIAHVRGGEELGRAWYDDGRLLEQEAHIRRLHRCHRVLIARKYGNRALRRGRERGRLARWARSRTCAPTCIAASSRGCRSSTSSRRCSIRRFRSSRTNTRSGAIRGKAAYDYMLSYSPYDNVAPHPYPALYVRTGLWDSQVQYYEPAKWVAKLRATKRDDNLLLFETDMHAGHEGASGRFDAIAEYARAYAFMLYVDGGATARRTR